MPRLELVSEMKLPHGVGHRHAMGASAIGGVCHARDTRADARECCEYDVMSIPHIVTLIAIQIVITLSLHE